MDQTYQLVVVSGPNRGQIFSLNSGDNTVGRQEGQAIVLHSAQVSKKHCVLHWNEVAGVLQVKDVGSSNGTFVNGFLVKSRSLQGGDRLSIGEFVLEVVMRTPVGVPQVEGLASLPLETPLEGPPVDPLERVAWLFEKKVMPFFYPFSERYEWRWFLLGFLVLWVLVSVFVSVTPLLEQNRQSVMKESALRAQLIARQVAEKNSGFLARRQESQTEIGTVLQAAEGVEQVLLIDLESRILAPAERMNQYLTSGSESRVAVEAREAFKEGKETGYSVVADEGRVIAVEPVKILNPGLGRNTVVAMALVSLDARLSLMGWGETGVIYSQIVIILSLLGFGVGFILYRMTLKPFEFLNQELDLALKGERSEIISVFKMQELQELWAVVNTAVHRIAEAKAQNEAAIAAGGGNASMNGALSREDWLSLIQWLSSVFQVGWIFLDGAQKIIFLNSIFEELSGIRADAAIDQEMSAVARDQSLGVFLSDLLSRLQTGASGVSEDYDFSGVPHRVHAFAPGSLGGGPQGYCVAVQRTES